MPHWAKLTSMSVKVLRGTSMVSMEASPYSASYLSSALALTISRVSVGSKCCWNLLPHGARIARSKLPASLLILGPGSGGLGPAVLSAWERLVWVASFTVGRPGSSCRCLCCRTASSDRLSVDMFRSRLLPGRTPDCLPPIAGRTLYLFKDCSGAAGAGCNICRAPSWLSWPACHIIGWDWERSFLSGLLETGQSGDTGGLCIGSASPEDGESLTASLLRPLEDVGLVKCICGKRRVQKSPSVKIHSCFLASVLHNKSWRQPYPEVYEPLHEMEE